jgi:hypothetical protein
MRFVRAGTETAACRESGGGMSSENDFIREGREGARRKPQRKKLHACGTEFAFTSRFFASFADKKS